MKQLFVHSKSGAVAQLGSPLFLDHGSVRCLATAHSAGQPIFELQTVFLAFRMRGLGDPAGTAEAVSEPLTDASAPLWHILFL